MKFNRGFTLIEILVVIVVIALLVSITALNTDGDPREDLLNQQAQRIRFYLEEATDEAILNNLSLAIYFTKYTASPYSWQKQLIPDNSQGSTSSSSQGQNQPKDKWDWSEYTSQKIHLLELQNDAELRLFVNDAEVPLSFQQSEEDSVVPQLIIQASGIQSIVRIEISIKDYDNTMVVTGNGAGRFKMGKDNDAI
jgi:type II secretion system protein H